MRTLLILTATLAACGTAAGRAEAACRYTPIVESWYARYLGRVTVLAGQQRELSHWRKRLFSLLHFSAQPAIGYYGIPPGRTVELGMQITL